MNAAKPSGDVVEWGRAPDEAARMYFAYLGTAALRRVDAAPSDSEDYITTLMAALSQGPPA